MLQTPALGVPRDADVRHPEVADTSMRGRRCSREDITYRQVSFQGIDAVRKACYLTSRRGNTSLWTKLKALYGFVEVYVLWYSIAGSRTSTM